MSTEIGISLSVPESIAELLATLLGIVTTGSGALVTSLIVVSVAVWKNYHHELIVMFNPNMGKHRAKVASKLLAAFLWLMLAVFAIFIISEASLLGAGLGSAVAIVGFRQTANTYSTELIAALRLYDHAEFELRNVIEVKKTGEKGMIQCLGAKYITLVTKEGDKNQVPISDVSERGWVKFEKTDVETYCDTPQELDKCD